MKTFSGILSIGYFIFITVTVVLGLYLLSRRILKLRQWVYASIAAIVWGIGGGISVLLLSLNLLSIPDSFSVVVWTISGLIAALLGSSVLYLLMRYIPTD